MKVRCERGPWDGKTIEVPKEHMETPKSRPGRQFMLADEAGNPHRYGELSQTDDDGTPRFRLDPFTPAEQAVLGKAGPKMPVGPKVPAS